MTLGISAALAAATADGTIAECLDDLRSFGGRVVAEMLEGAVDAVVKKKGDGGENDASVAAVAVASAAAAAAASHERLHSGPWHAVPPAWRDAYSLACLVQAEEETGGGKNESRMRLLDLALLLGGRRFRALAHSAAARLSCSSRSCSSLTPLPEAWPIPETPVELPPGSMGTSDRGQRVETLLSEGGEAPPPPVPPPSLEDFVSRATAKPDPLPFVVPSCVSSWPALRRWALPRYWDSVAGNRTVPVEVGSSYLEQGWSQELKTLRSFLDEHVFPGSPSSASSASKGRKTGYLAQHDLLEQVPELGRDVLTPDYALALSAADGGGGEGERSVGGEGEEQEEQGEPDITRNLWLGPARTLSPLHTDPKRNLFCQVFGRKYVRLYCPRESSAVLLLERGREGSGGSGGGVTEALTVANTSRADLFSPSESVASLRFFDVVLNPGDALYIPEKWWHFVLSLEPSASVSFWF